MFNSPLLDVTIGMVFIFLLYSLLATSINEAIASLFGLRARMLKNAIITGMLSNTSKDNRWLSILKGIGGFFVEISRMITGYPRRNTRPENIGFKFFDHPLIKNYGSSRIFPLPSYIPTKNFSTVLVDVLQADFNDKLQAIASRSTTAAGSTISLPPPIAALQSSPDAIKLMELFNYYECIYAGVISPATVPAIDRETLQILKMLLQNSGYDLGKFMVKLENWYDDSMKRVGGWYKRQTQLIIFIIGMILAITFNVDVIQVAGKLSSDKDARDKLVQLAVQAADKYKDDPRVKKIVVKEGTVVQDTTSIGKSYNDSIFKLYQANVDSAKKLIQGDISSANDILAIGWGDYGKLRDGSDVLLRYKVQRSERALDSLYNKYWIRLKVKYILVESGHGKKFLGFLILAFAVSLGSPFWFDLLNKMMKLRSSEQEATGTKVK